MKRITAFLGLLYLSAVLLAQSGFYIDHRCTYLYKIPASEIDSAQKKLHIAYGHTSHGSQLVSGMIGLEETYGSLFAFSDEGVEGSLDLHNYFIPGFDLGNPDFRAWADSTRSYLQNPANSSVNVVMWAWCGQLSWAPSDYIDIYLTLMEELELEFPDVRFVYMTGHLDGTGAEGNLNLRNEQIRSYCRENRKILYDFADIESFDPDSLVNFMELGGTDNCDYDSDQNNGADKNWAVEWTNAHPDSVFYTGSCEHSQSLNCQRKGIAAWWLFARLAGWGMTTEEPVIPVTSITVFTQGGNTTLTLPDSTIQLYATVYPANATNDNIQWSVTDETGHARIDQAGLLTALSEGTVTAVASASDGSGITGSLGFLIRGAEIPTIWADPEGRTVSASLSGNHLIIDVVSPGNQRLTMTDMRGRIIHSSVSGSRIRVVDTAALIGGIYLVHITGNGMQKSFKVYIP